MDSKTAQDLDYVLGEIKNSSSIDFFTLKTQEESNKRLQYDIRLYVTELENSGLIELNPNRNHAYRVTFTGKIFKGYQHELKEDNKERNREKFKYVITTSVGILGTLLGVWLGHKLSEYRELDKTNNDERLKIQIIHDTIYIDKP